MKRRSCGELGRAGTAGGRANVFGGQPHTDRLDAAREVRTGGRGNQQVAVLVGGTDTESGFGGEHERTEVERVLATGCGNPVEIDVDQFGDGIDEHLRRELRHGQTARRCRETLGVGLDAERADLATRLTVCLEALEDGLSVVQNHCGRIELDVSVRQHLGVVPALARGVVDRDHVVGEVPPEAGRRQNVTALGVGLRGRALNTNEIGGTCHGRNPI